MFDPFGALPANTTSGWHAEPDYRGTYGILSTCLVTMALCIWTAVHLNMGTHHKPWRQTGRKLGWLIIGLFAPELVAWTAFQQNRDASKLTRDLAAVFHRKRPESALVRLWRTLFWDRKSVKESDAEEKADEYELLGHTRSGSPTSAGRRRHPWTIVHSHFALMGGFAIDLTAFDVNFVPGKPDRLVLTADSVKLLASVEPTLIPDLSREYL